MNHTVKSRFLVSAAVVAFSLGSAIPALSQDKAAPKVEAKVLLENDKVRVVENHYKPGAENADVPRGARVVRAITSGTLQRIYPDGKKQDVQWKAGEVRFNPAAVGEVKQYTTKNIGKGELVLYLVILK
jgi:hypothetical protein